MEHISLLFQNVHTVEKIWVYLSTTMLLKYYAEIVIYGKDINLNIIFWNLKFKLILKLNFV